MKHLKKYEDVNLNMSDEEFTKNFGKEPEEKLSYSEAFDKYIKGQTVKEWYQNYRDFSGKIPYNEQHQGFGMKMENNYKIVFYGGGCSGEDCNYSCIVDPNGKLISTTNLD